MPAPVREPAADQTPVTVALPDCSRKLGFILCAGRGH